MFALVAIYGFAAGVVSVFVLADVLIRREQHRRDRAFDAELRRWLERDLPASSWPYR